MSVSTRLARLRGPLGLVAAVTIGAGALVPLTASAQQQQPRRPAATPPAQAQPPVAAPQAQPGAAPSGPVVVQLKAEPSQTEWTKVCGTDQNTKVEICYTTRDFVSDQGQAVLAVAVYDVKSPNPQQPGQKIARFLMPLTMLLQPGIRFSVDQAQAVTGKYAICFPNGCFAEAPIDANFINAVKKGTNLNVSAQNAAAREVTFAVPLAGFGKAFDGPAIDPKVLEEQQKKLQEELEKRSEELRKRLQQSGNATGAPAGTAAIPGATPAASGTPTRP